MPTLLIETATERSLIALGEGSQIYAIQHLPLGLSASRHLPLYVKKLLKEQKIDVQQLKGIICGQGPGSYTGIRVGAAFAKCLSLAHSIPLIGLCSLEGFIPSEQTLEEGAFCSLIDARSGGAFVMTGERKKGEILRKMSPRLIPWEQLLENIQAYPCLITPQRSLLEAHFAPFREQSLWKWEERHPDVPHLFLEAQKKSALGDYSKEGKLELIYTG